MQNSEAEWKRNPISSPLPQPVDKLLELDAVGEALSADVDCLQDPGVAQLHHHPLLAKAQCLPVIVGFDAAHKVRLTHHHLREQVHQGVLWSKQWEKIMSTVKNNFIS